MEILDLQAPPNDAMYLVSLDPISPYPKIVEPNRGAEAKDLPDPYPRQIVSLLSPSPSCIHPSLQLIVA